MNLQTCPECGTVLRNGQACLEYFNQMLAWDFSDFVGAGKYHHLTVLCYYLQHPSHYSVEGLQEAIKILKKAVEDELSDKELYQEESETFSSAKRSWNVKGTTLNHGSYPKIINWKITVSDVVEAGITKYPDHVQEWSQAIYQDLIDSDILK